MKLGAFWLLAMLCLSGPLWAQPRTGITTIDFVKVKDNKQAEVLSFFQNYWRANREIALKAGYIESYQLLAMPPGEQGDFDILLITGYPDSTAYALREERFGKIIKELSAGRPNTTGGANPREMFEIKSSQKLRTVASPVSGSKP